MNADHRPLAPHFSKGAECEVAFVLSCPGRCEEKEGHPAAGNTGKNLDGLLRLLGPRLGMPNLSRQQITITNAWARVEYLSKTGRSEASDSEVLAADNLARLAFELGHVRRLIVFCGEKAKLASQQMRGGIDLCHSVQIAYVPHLGSQGLNKTITSDVYGQPIVGASRQRCFDSSEPLKVMQRKNTDRRLKVVVERLLEARVTSITDQNDSVSPRPGPCDPSQFRR